MGVLNGQNVDQSITNAAFINKNQADTMPYQLGLTQTAPSAGTQITDVQTEANATNSWLGKTANLVYNALPSWASSFIGSATDSIKARIEAVILTFKATTGAGGHAHTGVDGQGPKITVASIDSTGASSGQVPSANGSGGVSWANASSGGGGGGSLQWLEYTNAPTPDVENQTSGVPFRIYKFQSGLAQSLYASIKVPNSYLAGSQIRLRTEVYSPDSSGTALIQTVATLIRQATDTVGITTNQRTSTNSAITLGAGTVNIAQGLTLDLTDSSGQINSVAVSAGDLILVQLKRGTDTGASDLRVPVYGAEVTTS